MKCSSAFNDNLYYTKIAVVRVILILNSMG